MKKFLIILSVACFSSLVSEAQKRPVYTTTSGEWIFSFANMNQNGSDISSIIRFSPVFNFQNVANFDRSDKFGFTAGLAFRNVGFIYNDPSIASTKYKWRTYNVGIPVGIKIGNMDKTFVYGGYELEIPVNTKEKVFVNDTKTKSNEWFSKQTNQFQSSVFVGIQMPYGGNLKFKYYLTNFFNKDYTLAAGSKPHSDFNVNIFYFSLNFFILKGEHFYYSTKD